MALFPEDDATETYAVVDTQFVMDEWKPGQPADQVTRDILSSFNHVRVGNGYPDLVGYAYLRWGEETKEFVGPNEAGLKELYVDPEV